ncbi:hypothetical protein JCM10213_005779 [Rhodosporidiobolus nylandii]
MGEILKKWAERERQVDEDLEDRPSRDGFYASDPSLLSSTSSPSSARTPLASTSHLPSAPPGTVATGLSTLPAALALSSRPTATIVPSVGAASAVASTSRLSGIARPRLPLSPRQPTAPTSSNALEVFRLPNPHHSGGKKMWAAEEEDN